jgi:hypothetical protein
VPIPEVASVACYCFAARERPYCLLTHTTTAGAAAGRHASRRGALRVAQWSVLPGVISMHQVTEQARKARWHVQPLD